jgi:hypothetical protein
MAVCTGPRAGLPEVMWPTELLVLQWRTRDHHAALEGLAALVPHGPSSSAGASGPGWTPKGVVFSLDLGQAGPQAMPLFCRLHRPRPHQPPLATALQHVQR